MKLPEKFKERMKLLLAEEYDDFILSFNKEKYSGLRVNKLKISVDKFLQIAPFKLLPVPWFNGGFYYNADERPAKHPYYYAGLYYLQEPSAMAPVAVADIKPGERVLYLCAAPGGKSTQAAAELGGEGILVANDINKKRIKALVKNLELFGIRNVIVTNEEPERLAERFKGFFDKILIDAPCSGEGMFRKDPDAVRQWKIHSVEKCAGMQRDILHHASKMLANGGRIIYSTCTFSPEENELMIHDFLEKNKDFHMIDIPNRNGFSPGRPEWANNNQELKKAVRLWPHKLKGEGHFIAVMEKKGKEKVNVKIKSDSKVKNKNIIKDYYKFLDTNTNFEPAGEYELFGSHLYLRPTGIPSLSGIKVVKPGLYLGELKKDRFQPAHGLALAFPRDFFKNTIDFSSDSKEVIRYLKGETLPATGKKGWKVVCVDSFPLGWAKVSSKVLKNYYPKGWRLLD